jgi:hypothetical protein
MKIGLGMIVLILALVLSTPKGLAAETPPAQTAVEVHFEALEKALKESRETSGDSANLSRDLERFQASLYRAMALDPTPGAAVPISEVPKELFSAELNADLKQQFDALQAHSGFKQAAFQVEFRQYSETVKQILALRESRRFPEARAIAKRGILDHDFKPLAIKSAHPKDASGSHSPFSKIEEGVKALREHVLPKDAQKRELFNNGNQFIWYAVVAFFGFFVGVLGIRVKPDFFGRFADTLETSVPAATTHSGGTQTLDYAKWLKELEEILSRLRSTQIGHERRIEDMVQHADQMVQHAQALSSDARIKNEPNLDFRMGGLVKQLRTQMEHAQKLKAGDRVQITIMMEHCLKLCDAIEAGAIHYDRSRPVEPPAIKAS